MASQQARIAASHKQILPFTTRLELHIFSIVTLPFSMWLLHFVHWWQ